MKPSSVSTTTTPAVRPRTQSLTDSSLNIPSLPPSSALQRTSWLVPHHHQSRTPSPSPSSASRHSIGSIKKSLIETIDAYSCSLEDKLTLVAKLHAEVEGPSSSASSWSSLFSSVVKELRMVEVNGLFFFFFFYMFGTQLNWRIWTIAPAPLQLIPITTPRSGPRCMTTMAHMRGKR
jgi:hypothetical protein